MVEQLPLKQLVTGSNPVRVTPAISAGELSSAIG